MTIEEPYVGPYPLGPDDRLYGRDRETIEIANQLAGERVFLLYAPSGAGKTSLIQAGLIKLLDNRGFDVHTTIRLHENPDDPEVNRFRYSMLRSLQRDKDALQLDDVELRRLSITEYLDRREERSSPARQVLIFDQFEEVLAFDSYDEPPKEEFLRDLGRALRPLRWWALFAIREDYLGAFDPYRRYLPNQLSSSFRLDLLRATPAGKAVVGPYHKADLDSADDEDDLLLATPAGKAVVGPAQEAGLGFTIGAAALLVRQLKKSEQQLPPDEDGTSRKVDVESPLIEPLELQVACRQIWHKVHEGEGPIPDHIGEEFIRESGGVDEALTQYYDKEVARAAVASKGQVRERQIRDWFGEKLVTKEGVRRIVRYGPARIDPTEDDKALQYLFEVRLVGKLPRDQVTWLELAHDRLAPRVLARNETWYEKEGLHLTPFERSAWKWRRSGERKDMLLGDEGLGAVDGDHPDKADLRNYERRYLTESRNEAKRRKLRRHVRFAIASLVLIIFLVLIASLWAVNNERNSANQAKDAAEAQRLAGDARATDDINLALLLGIEAIDAEPDSEEHVVDAMSALYQANGASRVMRTLDSASGGDVAGRALAAKDDGSLVVATAEREIEVVRNALTGAGAPTVEFSFAGEPTALAVSPAGAVAVVAGGQLVVDGLVDDEVAVGEARAAAFVDERTLALVLPDGSVMIYDTTDREVARSIEVPEGATTALSLGDGALAVGTTVGDVLAVEVITAESDVLLAAPSPAAAEMSTAVTALAIDDTGSLLAVARDDLSIRVEPIDGNREEVVELNATQVPPTAMVFVGGGSFDGPAVAIASQDVVRVADATTGVDLFVLNPATGQVRDIATVAPCAVAVATQNGAVTVWNMAVGHGTGGTTAVDTKSSTQVLTAGTDGRVLVWQVADGAVLAGDVVPGLADEAVSDLAVSGDRVVASSGAIVRLLETGDSTRMLAHEGPVRMVRFGQDSADVIAVGDRWIRLWDATDHQFDDLVVDPGDAAAVMSPGTATPVDDATSIEPTIVDVAVYSEDLFVLLPDRRVATWSLGDGGHGVLEPPETEAVATALAVTQAGLVAIGDDAGDVELLDQEGNVLGEPIGRSLIGAVTALAVGPGDRIAIAFGDHTVEVWSPRAERKDGESLSYDLDVRIPSRSRIRDVTFVADGTHEYVVIATDDGRLVIQPLDADELRSVAEDKASRDLTPRECERFVVC